jgi:fatty acid CoA ligase FadD9
VLIELEPFTHENGLLSSVRKPLRPKLLERYQAPLEALYQEMDRQQQEQRTRLRGDAVGLSILDRVVGALKAELRLDSIDPEAPQSYADLGGDSLGAVSLSLLLKELFGVEVPVNVILDPAGSPRNLARYLEVALEGRRGRRVVLGFASVHGPDVNALHASDLRLDALLSTGDLDAAARAAPPATKTRTILLTGATGFLGRFLCLEWMKHFEGTGGKVVCLVRARDVAGARARVDAAISVADPLLADRFRALAEHHLELLPGDLGAPRFGLGDSAFQRLSLEIDQIVHAGALVNHLLSYRNLFEPNVVGTAQLLRLALSGRKKRFDYVSTYGVALMHPALRQSSEGTDVREAAPGMPLSDAYAAGYGASKWASEVLLREANEHFGLPVTVYRPDMIMAHRQFMGQLNVPDMFTRLLFSLAATGIAPSSFYEPEPDGGPARVHFDGTPVDFLAAALRQIGASPYQGFRTFNTISAHLDDGISLDTITDWIASAGYPIQRLDDHADWLRRFAEKLKQLPDAQRQRSSLAVLGYLAQPHAAHSPAARNDDFMATVRTLPVGPEVPHLTETYIHKYFDDLRLLGLLPSTR